MATTAIPGSLMVNTLTVIRPIRSYAAGTKQPIVTDTTQATGVRGRLEPLSGRVAETVLGRLPAATHRLFTNYESLKANDLLKDEATNQKYLIIEVRSFFGHHVEAILERKDD